MEGSVLSIVGGRFGRKLYDVTRKKELTAMKALVKLQLFLFLSFSTIFIDFFCFLVTKLKILECQHFQEVVG